MARRSDTLDLNARIAALLRQAAAAQGSPYRRLAYGRAAEAIAALPAPVSTYVGAGGALRPIANVGPSSARVILEGLGLSPPAPGSERPVPAAGRAGGAGQADRAPERTAGDTFLDPPQVAAALRRRRRGEVSLADYRGDLQMHSTYSDGSQTLEDIAATAAARGYRYAAVTDHSHGLPVAGGMSMARLELQHAEIDRINARRGSPCRIVKGIEANILADGGLDLSRDERRRVEIVVAAPHSALRSPADQTARMLKAVRTPGVHILGHPRGRKRHVRAGLAVDWGRVFAAAAAATVAIEIDGDPRRQDIDHVLARRALDAGCIFALDSDAHAVDEWVFAETAVAHAKLAGIPRERVINCWPLGFLLDWAAGLRG